MQRANEGEHIYQLLPATALPWQAYDVSCRALVFMLYCGSRMMWSPVCCVCVVAAVAVALVLALHYV